MRKAIVYASVHHGITLIFEQKEGRVKKRKFFHASFFL